MQKSKNRLILVIGATGKQGGAVLNHLRARGFPVRAATRNVDSPQARSLIAPEVEVFRCDLDDADSVRRALDGAFGVYSVQTFLEAGIEGEIRQGKTVVDAALRADIDHFVYSSVGSADQKTGIPHFDSKFEVEDRVRRSGLSFTILRPVFFMENLLGMKQRMASGTFSMPIAPDTKLQMIAVDDIGAFAALAFEHPQHWKGKAVDIAGDELSMTEIAQSLGRVAGHEVKYAQTPWDQFEQQTDHETATMFHWFDAVGYHADIPARREEYASLKTFDRWLDAEWNKSREAA